MIFLLSPVRKMYIVLKHALLRCVLLRLFRNVYLIAPCLLMYVVGFSIRAIPISLRVLITNYILESIQNRTHF